MLKHCLAIKTVTRNFQPSPNVETPVLRIFHAALFVLAFLVVGGCSSYRVPHYTASPPRTAPRQLIPVAHFASPQINESSGVVKSSTYPDVYWTHNDSGDTTRIFPINLAGENVGPSAGQGIKIIGAMDRDWEDMASDHEGNLLIGAFGNNANTRRDLTINVVAEPDPYTATPIRVTSRVRFHFPEQTEFPPAENNYDVEALFVVNGEWYVMTKHRTDADTRLYRFESQHVDRSNSLTLLASFSSRGMVTAADALPDGSRVAVLVYGSIWLFEPPEGDIDQLFSGKITWRPIRAEQAEGICFIDRDTLLITNEQGALFTVKTTDLLEVIGE